MCILHNEKARSSIETREYYQTDGISWLSQKRDWQALSLIPHIIKNYHCNLVGFSCFCREDREAYLAFADKLFSRAVSNIKQAIESFNNWIVKSQHPKSL